MTYDAHVVRTKHWLDAAGAPITKAEVDELVAGDPELEWSMSDFVEAADDTGSAMRYYAIAWNGAPSFWWQQHEILCSDPDERQLVKLARIARALNARVVGDDGETYELRRNVLGRDRLVIIPAEA